MARAKYHVTPHPEGGWQVRREGAQRADSVHDLKTDAVDRGRDVASSQGPGQLVIHRRDGQIQTEHTYQDDPFPPRG